MRRRIAVAGLALLCALLASGCSLITKTVTVTVSGPNADTVDQPIVSCQTLVVPALGAAPTVHAGTCVYDGVTFQIVTQNQLLSLDELDLRVLSVRIGSRVRTTAKTLYADGRYIVLSVHVGNTWDLPARFDGGGLRQTALQGHSVRFTEALYTESQVPTSCLEMNDQPILPGHSETCLVIFDVPSAVAVRMQSRGAGLLVTDFGVDPTDAGLTLEGIDYVRPPARDAEINLLPPPPPRAAHRRRGGRRRRAR